MIDAWSTYHGYWSDLCRTFPVGSPTALQCEVYAHIAGIDDLSHGSMRNVQHLLGNERFSFRQFDCRDTLRMRKELAGVDAIVHLAAEKIPRYGGALKTLEANVQGANAAYQTRSSTTSTWRWRCTRSRA